MQKVLHMKTTVQPGGKVEFVSPELEAGTDRRCGRAA